MPGLPRETLCLIKDIVAIGSHTIKLPLKPIKVGDSYPKIKVELDLVAIEFLDSRVEITTPLGNELAIIEPETQVYELWRLYDEFIGRISDVYEELLAVIDIAKQLEPVRHNAEVIERVV